MPSPDGLPARRAALNILDSVLRRGLTMEAAAGAAASLADSDRRLALAIAGEAFRRLPEIDGLIDSRTRQRLPDDSKARMVLRLALAQKLGLATPDHAIVATALPLVDGGPRRLVHGVLGGLLRSGIAPSAEPPLPPAVEQRWSAAWGDAVVAAARRSIAARPPLDLSFKSADDCTAFCAATGARSLAPLHARLDEAGNVAALDGFDTGSWWVQDLAASLPARLVPEGARQVLDLAAAPGGKTMQLAARGHDVTALDRSQSRLTRLRANLERTGLAATIVAADALAWKPDSPFDAVLIDSPCSATGTFRRHPEVLYRARPAIIAEAAALQARLLDRAAGWVGPGGSLVYSVCSLEPEEGERQIEAFLAGRRDFRLAPAQVPVAGIAPTGDGWLRILPGMLGDEGGLDGFFIARLVRA
jgi:16S rRNA (cytosine967-C5)-methyltransferase